MTTLSLVSSTQIQSGSNASQSVPSEPAPVPASERARTDLRRVLDRTTALAVSAVLLAATSGVASPAFARDVSASNGAAVVRNVRSSSSERTTLPETISSAAVEDAVAAVREPATVRVYERTFPRERMSDLELWLRLPFGFLVGLPNVIVTGLGFPIAAMTDVGGEEYVEAMMTPTRMILNPDNKLLPWE